MIAGVLHVLNWLKRAWVAVALAAIVAILVFVHLEDRQPPIPNRPLRIGFENNPPVQIRSDSGFAGLAVETVTEAAKRAGVRLRWVETGTSSDAAFQKGLVDLWPLMADLPDRRKRVHITGPWLHSSHTLLVRNGSASPERAFTGRIALFKMPLHVRLLRERFPKAELAEFTDSQVVVKEVCGGRAAAGFLEGRVALTALREKPAECATVTLRIQTVPDLTLQHGVGSTFEAAGAAEAIRREIGNMFRDGTLAGTMAKYSYYGLDDSWASYDLMEAAEHLRWMIWGISGLIVALALLLWQASYMHQRKRAQAALRESEERFRNMADTAPVMIWFAGPDRLCTFFNKGWLDFTGRGMEQELGNGWTAGVHPDDLERCSASYFSSFDARESFDIEYRLRRADGEYRWVLCSGVPRFTGGGVFAGYIGTDVDVTDQKRAEGALRRSLDEIAHLNRVAAMGELTASLAHELNQPLAAILSNAQAASRFLSGKVPDLTQVRECLTEIAADDKRAGEVIKRLRALLMKESFQVSLVDTNEVVGDVVRLVRNDALLREVSLVFEPSPGEAPVIGDRVQLYQVALNLIVNGFEASAERPPGDRWVVVRTAEWDGGGMQLTVEDSGPGIAESDLDRVFEPFFSTKREGLGMGLSISRSIIQAHGGKIWAENSPRGGAIFRCVLPVAQKAATLRER